MIKAGRTNQTGKKETFLLNRLFLGSEIIFNFIKKPWILFLFSKPTVYKHDISILLSLHKEKDSSNFFVPGLKGSVGVKKPWQWFLFNVQDRLLPTAVGRQKLTGITHLRPETEWTPQCSSSVASLPSLSLFLCSHMVRDEILLRTGNCLKRKCSCKTDFSSHRYGEKN